jgi:Alpha-glutamyl/putrescinyl thymine pyrophosphorylase clade 3
MDSGINKWTNDMKPRDIIDNNRLSDALDVIMQERFPIPGLADARKKTALVAQLVESSRRVAFIELICQQTLSSNRRDPASTFFDPLKAAIICNKEGLLDEAFWLVFLSVHCGKHRSAGWATARDIYGRLNSGRWDWITVSTHTGNFVSWLSSNQRAIASKFGNHRKYQSLSAHAASGTGEAVVSYVNWIKSHGDHQQLLEKCIGNAQGNSRTAFDILYKSMACVASFGRTARFDYLSMISKLGLAPIEPGSVYLRGSTGPMRGALLLLGGGENIDQLEAKLSSLALALRVPLHVLEDALCNWQKSPELFVPFRG